MGIVVACPECKGKFGHKLSCGQRNLGTGILPMTLVEIASTVSAKWGCCARCSDPETRPTVYFLDGYWYCPLCWAFKRTQAQRPPAPTYSNLTITIDGKELKEVSEIVQGPSNGLRAFHARLSGRI